MSYTTLWIATKHCWIRLCVECFIAQAVSVSPHLRNSQVGQEAGHSPKTPCWNFIPNPVKLKASRPRGREVFRRRVPRTLFPAALFRSLKTKIGNTLPRPSPEHSDANQPSTQVLGWLRTYMGTMYRSAPFGFPRLFPRPPCRTPACVETFIISWYNQPKARKEAVVTWQILKARKGS